MLTEKGERERERENDARKNIIKPFSAYTFGAGENFCRFFSFVHNTVRGMEGKKWKHLDTFFNAFLYFLRHFWKRAEKKCKKNKNLDKAF